MMHLSKYFSLAICGLVAVAATADAAFAQSGGGGGRTMPRTRYELATLPEVQAELKLNDAQKKLATDLLAKQRKAAADRTLTAGAVGGFRLGKGGGVDFPAVAALQAETAQMNAEADAQLIAILDDTQKSRMNGLIAQSDGDVALLDAVIAKTIQLGDEQVAKLKSVNDANRLAQLEMIGSGMQQMSQEERQATMTKLTEQGNATLLAIISEEQKKKFDSLKGAEVKMDFAPLRQAPQVKQLPTIDPVINLGDVVINVVIAKVLGDGAEAELTIAKFGDKPNTEEKRKVTYEKVTKIVEVDGKNVERVIMVPHYIEPNRFNPTEQNRSVNVNLVQAFDVSGKSIARDDWTKLLETPRHVLLLNEPLSESNKLNPFYAAILREDTLLLFLRREIK
jgi:hypothetical protein